MDEQLGAPVYYDGSLPLQSVTEVSGEDGNLAEAIGDEWRRYVAGNPFGALE